MKILFWVPYPSLGASNRYRVEQFLPYLEKAGYLCTLRSFWCINAFKILYNKGRFFKKTVYFIIGTLGRILDLIRLYRYDVVFIHRESFPIGGIFFERIIRLALKPIIFDFDDAIFLASSSRSNDFIRKVKNFKNPAEIIKRSARVIAGNAYLAGYAAQYNSNTVIIPTCIDADKYKPTSNNGDNKQIVIGWIGSVTTAVFLELIRDPLCRILRDFPHVRFKAIGGYFAADSGLESSVINRAWFLESELSELNDIDIGIMPIPDTDWAKGKCAFKAIIYMSMGLPCVCSSIGANREIIKDGINGFLANNDNEWHDKLEVLIKDVDLRRRIGLESRRTVVDSYSVNANVKKFIDVFRDLA